MLPTSRVSSDSIRVLTTIPLMSSALAAVDQTPVIAAAAVRIAATRRVFISGVLVRSCRIWPAERIQIRPTARLAQTSLSEIAQNRGARVTRPKGLANPRVGLYAGRPPGTLASPSPDVTALLDAWRDGDRAALGQLLPLVYSELRRIAARQLQNERIGHTLQPTALVHEAYLRLVDQRNVDWQNEAHFFGVAAQVMRRVLVDHARRRGAIKRGEGAQVVAIEEASDVASGDLPILALDAALDRLLVLDPQMARIVELRAFAGLNADQAARILGISPSTVKRDLRTAKAWLTHELGYGDRRE